MIKIVGKDIERLQRKTCKNCLSILEFSNRDIQENTKCDYLDDPTTSYFIICPECEHAVYVRKNN